MMKSKIVKILKSIVKLNEVVKELEKEANNRENINITSSKYYRIK